MKDPLPPFSDDARLANPAYRADLLAKLTALISVLEVARAKVVVRLSGPEGGDEGDAQRLRRMRSQVENTLHVCRRAQLELRGGAPITAEEVLGTDIDALCTRLAGDLGAES